MPRATSKDNRDRPKIPASARTAQKEGSIYAGFGKYAAATSACIEIAVRDCLYDFYREHREQPQGRYFIQVLVEEDKVHVSVAELAVRPDEEHHAAEAG